MKAWLKPNFDTIPQLLQQHARWLLWTVDGTGRKVPRNIEKPNRNIDASKPSNWATFAQVVPLAEKHQYGIGFALGAVQDGPTFAGIDIDKCRNPENGVIEPWALRIISSLNSYTEISPSGTGVKIFVLGSLADGERQGKVYKLEIYDRSRYFTLTGHHLQGTPLEVANRGDVLRQLHGNVWSKDLVKLVKIFGFYISDGPDFINIQCPWTSNHSGGNQVRDAGLHLTDGKVDGFNCFHAGCSERTLGDIKALFGIKGGNQHDFITNQNGQPIAKSQENIIRALELQGVKLEHDRFSDKKYITVKDTPRRHLDDDILDDIYLTLDGVYSLSPPRDYFDMVIMAEARMHPFHPVIDYLNALKWDGVPRLDTWLTAYGGAEDTELTRMMASKTLIAAVRRVLKPGIKFDTMLVLESAQQGVNKSTAIATLCPGDWFSDDFPMHADSKQIIERTAGKWVIEASDLAGLRKSEVEHLKGMLSRQVDGPVRMAYARVPIERPRQFIIIGTTNNTAYLKDTTGNRRFWPVTVTSFDIAKLKVDRDQLWAEAMTREAAGESITLSEAYWETAAQEQENRRILDPWEEILRDSDIDLDATHIPVASVWAILGVTNFHDVRLAERLHGIMQALGYPLKQRCRYNGHFAHHWIRKDVAVEKFGLKLVDARPDFIQREPGDNKEPL